MIDYEWCLKFVDIIVLIITYFSGFEDGNNHLEKRNRDNNKVTAPMKNKKKKEPKQRRWLRKLFSFKSQFPLPKSAPSFQEYE